jgi:hypothetical protein
MIQFYTTNGSAIYTPPTLGSGNSTNISLSSLGVNPSSPNFSTAIGDVKVWWSIANDNITFTVYANTTGWVSIGISNTPFMPYADLYMVKERGFILTYIGVDQRGCCDIH